MTLEPDHSRPTSSQPWGNTPSAFQSADDSNDSDHSLDAIMPNSTINNPGDKPSSGTPGLPLDAIPRLLALKRHEKPAAPFFETFSQQLRQRIEQEQHTVKPVQSAQPVLNSWLNSLLQKLGAWSSACRSLRLKWKHSWALNPVHMGANAVILLGMGFLAFSVFQHVNRPDVDTANADGPTIFPSDLLRAAGPHFSTTSSWSSSITPKVQWGASSVSSTGNSSLLRLDIQPMDFPMSDSPGIPSDPLPEPSLWENY